ncbi:transcription factor RelB isoform X2 [Brachyhypopomus gauderio]
MSSVPPTRSSRNAGQRVVPAGRSQRAEQTGTEQLERLLEKPALVVLEQPKERGMRFRYECEGRSAGSILGAFSTDTNKTLPTIELQGPIKGIKTVVVTVSLVTKDLPHRPHPHCLVGRDCSDGICVIRFNPHVTRRHSFVNLGIQCVRRKELDASLKKRRNKKIDPFNTGHSKSIEDMDMNVVRLCFQCELEREDGDRVQLSPLVSNPIYDKKATTTAELKINRLNVVQGPCTGKTEVYMLCDKVQKDDIEIIFSLDDWEAKAEFAHTDVHRQIAIVFKTPPYQEQDLAGEVEVNVSLRRISDRMYSEPVRFVYLPHNPDPYEVNRKRKIKSDIKLSEECSTCPAPDTMINKPAPSQQFEPFYFGPLDCGLPSAPPAAQDENKLLQLNEIHYMDDDLKQEDSCVSLDQDTMNSILFSITECLGAQNVFQLLNGQDPNSNILGDGTDTNLNVPEMDQPQLNLGSYTDAHFNQMVSQGSVSDRDTLPLDLQGIYLSQVKTENAEDS